MLDSKCALGRTSDFQDTFALLYSKAIFMILESYNDDDDRTSRPTTVEEEDLWKRSW